MKRIIQFFKNLLARIFKPRPAEPVAVADIPKARIPRPKVIRQGIPKKEITHLVSMGRWRRKRGVR